MSAPYQVARSLNDSFRDSFLAQMARVYCFVDRGTVIVHSIYGGHRVPLHVYVLASELGRQHGVEVQVV